ncbi:hypothetical protein FCH28_17290 [Streptomyces piniterrae]|uniref:Secreted protein n=1 Tax=Streptomyces piniterrae TaxID=2571125 RepID=A0A4U0NG63_9ACTN|nr:hypothetical protein [Streptomyces piniterrae]TJZ52923.1 hypothetical protein FCH28_17290 [Streptomyces piniterrae]
MRATALTLATATVALLACGTAVAASAAPQDGPWTRTVSVEGKLDRLTAWCPDGYRVTSGGFHAPGYEMEQTITTSRPTSDGTGWVVSASAVNPDLLKQLDSLQGKQDAVDNATTDASREAARRDLEDAQKVAYDMPQRAAIKGTAYAVCTDAS